MIKNKCELQFMTWKEAEKAYSDDPVVFIPMGSMEEHGPHSIMGDYVAAYEVARRAAEQSKAYVTPVLPFGYSEYFRCYPGTISLSKDTLYKLVYDVCLSLMEHGIKKIIFVNGHGGNSAILEQVARDILREKKIVLGQIDIWKLSTTIKERIYGDKAGLLGHGGEPITSVMMYLRPDDMRPDMLKGNDMVRKWREFDVRPSLNSPVGDMEVTLYFDMDEIASEGILGDPYIGSAQIGEKLIDELVAHCVQFAGMMKSSDNVKGVYPNTGGL